MYVHTERFRPGNIEWCDFMQSPHQLHKIGEDILKPSVDLFLNTMKQAQHAFGSVRSKSI